MPNALEAVDWDQRQTANAITGSHPKPYVPSLGQLLAWLPIVQGVHLVSRKISKRLDHKTPHASTKRGSVERNEVAGVIRANRAKNPTSRGVRAYR